MAKQPDPAPTDSVMLNQFAGVKNTVTRERLAPQQQERARNLDIDDAGQPRRRRGYTQKIAGDFHSLWTAPDGRTFCVRNGRLCLLKPDYTTIDLTDGGYFPVAFHDIGDTIYFTSLDVSGKVMPDLTVLPWGQVGGEGTWLSPVVRPTETLGEVRGKLLGKPPLAEYLAYLNGRLFLATDNVIWATELYLYDYVDKTRSFLQFESKITGLANGTDGLYVGTETALWYLEGPLAQMKRSLVISLGILPRSMIGVPADLLTAVGAQAEQSKNATLMMSEQGVIAAFDGGVCVNLTKNETLFPTAQGVAAMFRKQDGINQYVAVLDSGGTPTAGTRIGDYVDAEIRRFQG